MVAMSEEHAASSAEAEPALLSPPRKAAAAPNRKTIYRGITNANGTSCHTSSALQLLFHCFPRLREELLNLANVSVDYYCPTQHHNGASCAQKDRVDKHTQAIENEFVYHLSWFFYLLAYAEDITSTNQTAAASSDFASSAVVADSSPKKREKSKSPRKSNRGSPKKTTDKKKAAAIDAFISKSREGKSNMMEWRNLVDSMKQLNRKSYDQALGQVMHRRDRESEQSVDSYNQKEKDDGQSAGNLGGGRAYVSSDITTSTLTDATVAIDPSKFYEQLMSYTTDAMETSLHINTNNVGDAAIVFRCLITALEISVNRELKRLDEMIGLFEVENWNREMKVEEYGQTHLPSTDDDQRNAYTLRSSIAKVKAAMEYEWKGNLLSRIVGTSQTATVSPENNIITTTTITRTKKNGNIERPIPVPWQLPLLDQSGNATAKSVDESTQTSPQRNYFESLITSLHSVTIFPNPIRGYNWQGLVKSGDVNEETSVTKMDECGNILCDKEHGEVEMDHQKDDNVPAVKSSTVEVPNTIDERKDEVNDINEEAMSPARTVHSDDVSVISRASVTSVSSRTIGTQTDPEEVELKTITVRTQTEEGELDKETNAAYDANDNVGISTEDTSETSSAREASRQSNISRFAIEKDACYAAAVAALTMAPKKRRSPKRKKKIETAKESTPAPDKSERDACYAAAVAALAGGAGSPSRDSISGVEVSFSASLSNHSNNSDDDSWVDDDESESTVDDKVPSVDDESSQTHSSAIETPSDIDNISLGSWTDSEAEEEEKKQEHEPLIRSISPVRAHGNNDAENIAAHESENQGKTEAKNIVPTEVAHSVCSNSISAVSELNDESASSSDDDSSTSSSSSSSTSSTGSDSTSSTDSSSSSSSTSSSDSSSSERDVAAAVAHTGHDDESSTNSASTKKLEWTTRKETRFCQLPRSLIFHLKRFAFTPSGHVEKLSGSLNIPACCMEEQQTCDEPNDEQYCYQLTGALVHVDPELDRDEKNQMEDGTMTEGHYVTFICSPKECRQNKMTWVEIDDEFVRLVGESSNSDDDEDVQRSTSTNIALNILSGCDISNNETSRCKATSSKRTVKEKERRYATLVVYSRKF